jgi:small conductance mechanosensitive channel
MAVVQQQMKMQQQLNLLAVQRRLLQVGQLTIWGGGTFAILGLFPYSRWLQPLILLTLEGPLKVLGIGLGTSVVIRMSAVLVDRFLQALKDGEFLPPKASQRLALRVSTFSLVLKRTTALGFIGIGILLSLSAIGVNVGPLLAGAGIVGLAVSFASQNLIKDVINGFLILLDDQYAVGDVIVVGNVGGFVENMNLRITQLRNDEGRLITIPNSQITIVQNLSKDWSRVDLKIYVACDTDLNQAFNVIEQVGLEMRREPVWRQKILESPEILGVDELNHTGIMIRVWIKTRPLEQWNVAREYRRRLKSILDQKGISIGMPQQLILLKNSLDLTSQSFDVDHESKLQ